MKHYSLIDDKGKRIGRRFKRPVTSCESRIMYQRKMYLGSFFQKDNILRRIDKRGEILIEIISRNRLKYPGYYYIAYIEVISNGQDIIQLIIEAEEMLKNNN